MFNSKDDSMPDADLSNTVKHCITKDRTGT